MLAIDPGLTCGWAKFWDGQVYYGQCAHPDYKDFAIGLSSGGWTVVVERPFLRIDTNPVVFKSYGVFEYLAYVNECNFEQQQPGVVKFVHSRYETRERAHSHSHDALCHLLYFLREVGNPDWVQVLRVLK